MGIVFPQAGQCAGGIHFPPEARDEKPCPQYGQITGIGNFIEIFSPETKSRLKLSFWFWFEWVGKSERFAR
jgi:hypothetical protein